MNAKEAKDICQRFLELRKTLRYDYGFNAEDIIHNCDILEAMGWEFGHQIRYPDFRIRKGYYITNNGTGHKSNNDEWYVEWDNGNVGRLQFVSSEWLGYVGEEWENFKKELMSYNPVNYDPMNCHIIYDVENGKRVLENYQDICKRTREAIEKKLKQARIEKAKSELERLIKEEQNDD